MTPDFRWLDEPVIRVQHDSDGGWWWACGRAWHRNGFITTPYIAKGTALTRWGAERRARRAIRKDERHWRLREKDINEPPSAASPPPVPVDGNEG